MRDWWGYVQRISNGALPAQVARDAGLDKSAPSRWSNGGGVEAAQAVRVARAYGANVVEALAAAGFISHDEVELTEVVRGLDQHSSVEMLRELLRRAERDPSDPAGVDELQFAANVDDDPPNEDLRTP